MAGGGRHSQQVAGGGFCAIGLWDYAAGYGGGCFADGALRLGKRKWYAEEQKKGR